MRKAAAFGIVVIVVLVAIIAGPKMVRKHGPPNTADKQQTGISVRVAYARAGTMLSTVEVSGDIRALKQVVLSAKISGRVVSVPFREGDSVSAERVVVQQDTSDLCAQVRQAEAALESTKSKLSQALTSARLSDTQTEAQVAQAKAALDGAKANLRMLKTGARTQERAQAENAVASAKANFEHAKQDLERMRGLYAEGAISKQRIDLIQMQYDVAAAQYDSAKQQLSLVKAGARDEEIESAEKQVAQAQEALRIAEANRARKALRQEDIKVAEAGVAQAEASLAYARQQLANASIRTPISGTVSRRLTEPGEMASPGAPLIEIVALDTAYFEASVSETDMHKVKVGQPVRVSVDALPGRKFGGAVHKIFPTADKKTRQFTVRIQVLNRIGALKPGMFARGSIEVAKHEDTVIIPKDALIPTGKGLAVYVVLGSVAKSRPVTLGFETREEAEVLSGASPGDKLVVVGQDKLSDGVRVHVAD